jgi:pyridoxamine 5'-phosphate oxidase
LRRDAVGHDAPVADARTKPLDESDLPAEPLRLFRDWYEQARAEEANSSVAALATADRLSRPSVRMVQLEGVDLRGFLFYTGHESRKGRELAANPRAAMCFYWPAGGHQVRVEGGVVRAPLDDDEAEFAAGARNSATPRQDEPVAGREELEARVAELRARYGAGAPPLPEDWGGYRLVPEAYEFWQYREDKLHDRFRYRRRGDGPWEIERLFP